MKTESEAARDEAIARVASPNKEWIDRGKSEIQKLPLGWLGTGECMRFHLREIIGEPTHPNAWGALIKTITSKSFGVFEGTGRLLNMKDVSSHARLTREYVKML